MATTARDPEAFRRLTEPYRRELLLHCYRMLGSLEDAEDAVQETLLAAWRGLDAFEGRASVRSWLYRIATNRALNTLRTARRRPAIARTGDPPWLGPFPDALLDDVADAAPGPEARYEAREAISLAFVTALQALPPRQRAVLVMRDVLGFSAAETAALLESSVASVNSALLRARAGLDERVAPRAAERARLPQEGAARQVAGRFADAFVAGDVDGVVALLAGGAVLTMPPEERAVEGARVVAMFLRSVPAGGAVERFRLVPTTANGGQPAFGLYVAPDGHPASAAHGEGLLVLDVDGAGAIRRISVFHRAGDLVAFGLPEVLVPAAASTRTPARRPPRR